MMNSSNLGDAALRCSIAIMAKAPLAGYAKTRLAPLLGAAGAARAQRGFVLRTLATAAACMPDAITLWCAPDEQQRFFRALRRKALLPALRLRPQCDGELGKRMAETFTWHARTATTTSTITPGPLLLIGTDCPVLTSTHLRRAAQALIDGADAVFGPVEDGGYVLVGLRAARPEWLTALFGVGIEWSTPRVMAQTRDRTRAARMRWHELAPPLWDVDEPADWLRWQALRPASGRLD